MNLRFGLGIWLFKTGGYGFKDGFKLRFKARIMKIFVFDWFRDGCMA